MSTEVKNSFFAGVSKSLFTLVAGFGIGLAGSRGNDLNERIQAELDCKPDNSAQIVYQNKPTDTFRHTQTEETIQGKGKIRIVGKDISGKENTIEIRNSFDPQLYELKKTVFSGRPEISVESQELQKKVSNTLLNYIGIIGGVLTVGLGWLGLSGNILELFLPIKRN